MFGNKKMYKKGLADAMQAYEGFSEKQKAALEQMRREVDNGNKKLEDALAGLGDELNGIYQYLNAKEKAALYHLNTPLDIKKLELEEQQLLVAVLYQLAEDEDMRLNDNQRNYIRSVQRYLGITNPQTSADLSVVGDIDSLDVQKAFLQVVLEFFYLQDGEEITDSQADFLANFSVNKKQAAVIENCVSRLYNAVGAEGVAEKFGVQAEEQSSPDAVKKALDEFERWLKDLAGCASWKLNTLGIDHSSYSVSAYDRTYNSKDKCRQAAERRVEKAIREAEAKMDERMKTQKSGSFYNDFKHNFTERLESLRDRLRSLRNAETAEIVDKMEGYMVVSKIFDKAKRISDNLACQYRLQGVSSYSSDIDYEVNDPSEFEDGFAKLFAKGFKTYGYDCLSVFYSIESDMRECLEDFQQDFNSQIQDEILTTIVEPILELLPDLRDTSGLDFEPKSAPV